MALDIEGLQLAGTPSLRPAEVHWMPPLAELPIVVYRDRRQIEDDKVMAKEREDNSMQPTKKRKMAAQPDKTITRGKLDRWMQLIMIAPEEAEVGKQLLKIVSHEEKMLSLSMTFCTKANNTLATHLLGGTLPQDRLGRQTKKQFGTIYLIHYANETQALSGAIP